MLYSEVQKLHCDGVHLDDQKIISNYLKAGDSLEFDCHIYNKEGFENFKDHCSYYIIRAWRSWEEKKEAGIPARKCDRPPYAVGTGWISEIFPRKGILIFNTGGQTERVLFLASKVYIFEKRLGTKQSLDQVSYFRHPVAGSSAMQNMRHPVAGSSAMHNIETPCIAGSSPMQNKISR